MTKDIPKGSGLGPDDAILHARSQPFDAIFAPRTIAVVGATEKAGSVCASAEPRPTQQPDPMARSRPERRDRRRFGRSHFR